MSIRFVLDNAGDSATLSSADFIASLPVSNLQLEGRARVARTFNATGTKTINGDFAGVVVCRCCVLYGHNLSGTASWRLRLYSGAAQTGSVVYDSGSITPNPPKGWGNFAWGSEPWGGTLYTGWERPFFATYFAGVQALSFKLELTDASNPAGYLQVKRLLIGNYFEPVVNVSYGLAIHWEDNSQQRRTQGGSLRTDARTRYRVARGNFGRLDENERAQLMDALRAAALRSEIFVTVYPGEGGAKERDHSLLGKLKSMPKLVADSPFNWISDFEIEEV